MATPTINTLNNIHFKKTAEASANTGNYVSLCDLVYPVGSIYLSYTKNENPAAKLGGTWTQLDGERYLMTNGSSSYGGSWNHKHLIPFGIGYVAGTGNSLMCALSTRDASSTVEQTDKYSYKQTASEYTVDSTDIRSGSNAVFPRFGSSLQAGYRWFKMDMSSNYSVPSTNTTGGGWYQRMYSMSSSEHGRMAMTSLQNQSKLPYRRVYAWYRTA